MASKKQVVTVAGIAVISFLIGILFNMSFVVRGGDGSPWEKVWTEISGLQSNMNILEDRVETLEGQSLLQGFIRAPAYDSGWLPTSSSSWITLEHGLNTTEVFVYFLKNHGTHGINQFYYGDAGFAWRHLTDNEIIVAASPYGDDYTEFRVMIWKISEPPT